MPMPRAARLTLRAQPDRITKLIYQLLISFMSSNVKYVLVPAMAQVVLWFLLAPALLILLSQLVPTVSGMAPPQIPGRPSWCGNVHIPYPFGIGDDCAWSGLHNFTVTCNHSSNPPRPYIGNIQIMDISLESGQLRVFSPVSHICYNSSNTTQSGIAWEVNLTDSAFLISSKRNKFTAIGCNTLPILKGKGYLTGCITTCRSLESAANDGEQCMGLGCCQTPSIPANLQTIKVDWSKMPKKSPAWRYSPCSYAFVAQKGWYNFRRKDLNDTSGRAFDGRPMPLVLDWAIERNETCPPPPANPVAPACVSAHSHCVNSTDRKGYLCKCSHGYSGNPYVTGGCTNINECELRKSDPKRYENQYPCQSGSTCRDTKGDYECECNFWRRGDGKSDKGCQPIFPAPAMAIVASIVAVIALVVLLCFTHREHKRRQLRGFFNKNGGQILKTMNINIFKKEQLDRITNNYSNVIGKGNFGEVFLGTTEDNQQVAVKRSIAVNNQDDFVNEITIQLQISHTNLVRLVGCCLETDVPMLVFDFIPNGSLYSVLHGTKKHILSLPIRLDIAIGSAEALAYMHSHANHKILHGDVKSGNILLDQNFQPKVSDFGTSRLLSMEHKYTGFVIGDRGYIDPVYMQTGLLTEKSDVYSFGVVLLELVTGKTARYNGNKSLPIDFKKSYETRMSRAREMLDETFTSAVDIDSLEMVGSIAVQCLKEYVDERPTMAQVVEYLKLAKLIAKASSLN